MGHPAVVMNACLKERLFGLQIFLVGACPPPFGGVATVIQRLAELLPAHGATVRILELTRRRGTLVLARTWLAALLRRGERVFHCHSVAFSDNSVFGLAALCLIRLSGGRIVISVHHGGLPAELGGWSQVQRGICRIKLRLAQWISCDNAEIELALTGLATSISQRVSVVGAAYPLPDRVEALPQEVAEFVGAHSPLLVSSGWNLAGYYGFESLIVAADHLRRNGFDRLGLYIGYSDEGAVKGERLKSQILACGLAGHVLLTNSQLAHTEFLELLRRADVYVRPSAIDGDSVAVREALMLGTPVVASDTGQRPQGVILYRGDLPEELACHLAEVVSSSARRHSPRSIEDARANLDRTIRIYRNVGSVQWPHVEIGGRAS